MATVQTPVPFAPKLNFKNVGIPGCSYNWMEQNSQIVPGKKIKVKLDSASFKTPAETEKPVPFTVTPKFSFNNFGIKGCSQENRTIVSGKQNKIEQNVAIGKSMNFSYL